MDPATAYSRYLTEVTTAHTQLTGTAKQIAWATDIRDSLTPWLVRVLDTMDRAITDLDTRGLTEPLAEHREHRALLLQLLAGITDTAYWIRMRSQVGTLPALVLTYTLDRDARRAIDTDLWHVDTTAALTPVPTQP